MRNAILLLSTVAITSAAQAQTMAGFKAGVNYSLYNINELKAAPAGLGLDGGFTGIGWHVGGYLQYNFAEHIGLRGELLWSARAMSHDLAWDHTEGDSLAGTVSTLSGTYKGTYSYIEFPVLLALQMGDHFTLHVGPGIAMLMSAHLVKDGTLTTRGYTTTSDTTIETSVAYDISGKDAKTGTSSVDIGACLGGVYELDGGLAFGVRGWYGFGTLEDPVDWTETRGMVLQASVGWNFMDNRRSRRRR